jgi:hypothetical protein
MMAIRTVPQMTPGGAGGVLVTLRKTLVCD